MEFIFGRELNKKELYDRDNEINKILNSYKTRQPVAVIGFRRMGKSSILNAVKSILGENNVFVIKFNIEGISNLQDYSNRLIESVIVELSKKYRLKYYKEEIKRLINRFIGSINQVNIKLNDVEIILNKYNDYMENMIRASEVIEDIINLPEKMAKNIHEKIVVIIDEFQYIRFLKQPFHEILRIMRSKFNEHTDVQYIISGSEIGIIDELLNNKNEPFYAFFRIIKVLPFNKNESINFLKEGLENYNIKCDKAILEEIYEITSGIPAWLNLAGLDLAENNCNISSFLNDDTYKNIIKYELNNLTKNEFLLLKELSYKKIKEIKISNKYRIMKSLINKGLLTKDQDKYLLVDGLLHYYLKNL